MVTKTKSGCEVCVEGRKRGWTRAESPRQESVNTLLDSDSDREVIQCTQGQRESKTVFSGSNGSTGLLARLRILGNWSYSFNDEPSTHQASKELQQGIRRVLFSSC